MRPDNDREDGTAEPEAAVTGARGRSGGSKGAALAGAATGVTTPG